VQACQLVHPSARGSHIRGGSVCTAHPSKEPTNIDGCLCCGSRAVRILNRKTEGVPTVEVRGGCVAEGATCSILKDCTALGGGAGDCDQNEGVSVSICGIRK